MKFQVTRLSALLGDPAEYLRTLGHSINSAGFTDQQIEKQMNTIQRKAETLKASLEHMVVDKGQASGLTQGIKGLLDALNQLIKGLNTLNPELFNALGTFTKVGVVLAICTSLFKAYTLATKEATIAQAAYNLVTSANPYIMLVKVLAMATTALAGYAYFAGNAANEQERLAQSQDNMITQKRSEIDMMKQQVDFMGTLGDAYVQQQENIKGLEGDEKKLQEAKKVQGVISEQLASIVGKEAADRILASEDVQAAITEEQRIHSEKIATMTQDFKDLVAKQIKTTKDNVAASNERLSAMNNEAIGTAKAAKAICESLDAIDRAMFNYYRGKAEYMNNMADMLSDVETKDMPLLAQIGINQIALDTGIYTSDQAREEANKATAKAEEKKQVAVDRELQTNGGLQSKLQGLYQMALLGDPNSGNGGGGEVPPGSGTTPKEKGSGSDGPSSPSDSERRKRIQNHSELKQITEEMKASADRYAESLDNLNTKESLYGKTVESTTDRFELLRKRMAEMGTEQENLANLKAKFQGQIEEYIAKDQEFQENAQAAIAGWDKMSNAEKRDYIIKNKDDFEDSKTLHQILSYAAEIETKLAEAHKNANKLKNDLVKDLFGDNLDVTKKAQKKLDNIGLEERIQKAGIDPRQALYSSKENAVELNASNQRIAAYEEEGTRLKQQLEEAEEARQREINATRDSIKALQGKIDKVKELAEEQQKLDNLTHVGTAKTIELTKDQKENDAKLGEEKQKNIDIQKKFMDKLHQTEADALIDLANHAKSLKDIAKDLLKELQKDAIYALLKVPNKNPGLFSNLLGKQKQGQQNQNQMPWNTSLLGGGSNNSMLTSPMSTVSNMLNGNGSNNSMLTSPMSTVMGFVTSGASSVGGKAAGGKKGGLFGKHATGGIVNVPSIAGEDGEEVIIPTEKNTGNSGNLLNYAASKINDVTPYTASFKNPALNNTPIVNVEAQQNEALVEELRTNNAMMKQQNHLLLNSDFGGGGGVYVISTQMSDEQILSAVKRNPGALQNILGGNKNKGWR